MNKLPKNIFTVFTILLMALMSACVVGGRTNIDKPASPNLVNVEEEEEEYELTIIDPGYQSWKITNVQPINFYSPAYYKIRNQQYVAAWNEKVNQQARYNSANYPFENRIDYNPNIDYGVELDYELYWYFRYIQNLYGSLYNFPGYAFR